MRIDPIGNILKLCLEEKLSGEKLVVALENEVAQICPYNHNEDSSLLACGMGAPTEKGVALHGSFSEVVEQIESSLTKRQLAYQYTMEKLKNIEKAKLEPKETSSSRIDSLLKELREKLEKLRDSGKREVPNFETATINDLPEDMPEELKQILGKMLELRDDLKKIRKNNK